MKKRLKGLACWWLVLVMLVSMWPMSAITALANTIQSVEVMVYSGNSSVAADELASYDKIAVIPDVALNEQSDVTSVLNGDLKLTGWDVWDTDWSSYYSGYVFVEKVSGGNAANWEPTASELEQYANDYSALVPVYGGDVAIYTDTDEVAADKFVGDYEVVSAKTDKALSEQAEVMNVLDSLKSLEGWDVWSAGWSRYYSGTVWIEKVSEESADYTPSAMDLKNLGSGDYYLVPVYGAAPPHKHPICGAAHTDIGDHTGTCENVDWTAWDGITDFPGGNVYLSNDITLEETLEISSGTVNLCLNGNDILSDNTAIKVTEGAILNICDCSSDKTGTIKSGYYGIYNGGGAVNIYGGKVSGTSVSTVYISGGTLNLKGGRLESISAENNATALYITSSASVEISGGEIYAEGGSDRDVCGVLINDSTSSTTISGGTISAGCTNTASSSRYYTVAAVKHLSGNLSVIGGTLTTDTADNCSAGYVAALYDNRQSNDETSTITISGGTFELKKSKGSQIIGAIITDWSEMPINLSGDLVITAESAPDFAIDPSTPLSFTSKGLNEPEEPYTVAKQNRSSADYPWKFTTGWSQTGISDTDIGKYFVAYGDNYRVTKADNGELQLSETYTISFDAYPATSPDSQKLLYGEKVTKPTTPVREGYGLSHWCTDSSCTNGTTCENAWDFDTDTVTKGDTLYAVWESTHWRVTLRAQGGECDDDYSYVDKITGKLESLPTATRVGYTFNGWFDASEGGNKITTETEFTGDTRIYAQWTAYEITQQPTVDNEYEVKVNPSANVAYTWHEMTETAVTAENAGIYEDEGYSSSYTAGWWSYHSTEGMGTPGYFSIDLNAGDVVEVELSHACSATVRIYHYYYDGTVTRYQDYEDIESGSKATLVAPADAKYDLFVSVYNGVQPTVKAKVIKAGKAIDGQTTSKLTDGVDGTKYVAKITYPDGAVLTSDAVCYVSPSFDVTFDTDGGTAVSKQTVENGGKVEEPATPSKTGYTFAGWYKDSELETAWDFDTDTVTEPTTLYAKWMANTNTPYVVNHWVQTLDAAIKGNAEKNETNYTLNEDENLTGTTDATFKANTKEIDGFKAPDKENITIAADGSTVHNYYYTRNKYNIVINTDEGVEELSGDGQYYYEQAVEISATLKSGYKWNEWLANETGYGSANISYSFNMPATALVLSPKTTSKAEVSINTDVQSYTYDKSAKAFEIRETDLTGFTVSYEQNGIAVTPINAGFYDVILSRAEDENYKEYSKTLVNGLIINKVIIDEPLIIDKPYNGFAQTADISDTETYEVTENAGGTNVGAYDVVLTLKDTVNYKWRMEENSGATATRKFFITFTENTWDVEPQITGWTFGQEPSEPTFDAKFGEVVVEYKKASEEDSSYTTDIPENAGDYKVKFTVEATTNFGSLSEILDLTIAKAIPSLEAPTAQNDITYGATLSTVGLTEGWTWLDGTTIPTVQNSGFVACFTPADTANYDWTGIDGWNEVESRVEKTVSVTVTKADSSIAAAPTAILNLEYDGSAKALVNAGTANGGTMQYSLDGTTWSTDIPTRTDAGVYTVHYKVTGDANHNDNEGGTVQVTIAKSAPSLNSPEAITNLIYNGTTQPLTTNGTVAGGEIQFSTSENGTYAPAIITGENAGNYEVWYKIIGDNNHTDIAPVKLDISIAQKSVEGATVGTFVAMTYTENAQTPAATVTIDGLTATGTWSNVTNVEDVTTFTASGNFTGTIANQSTGMAKATPVVTAPVAKASLIYNTSALALADEGSTTGGTMQYSLDNISWSNDIPSGTNAGDYTIYYRVVGNSNYNDVAAQSIPVSIANANMSADITAVGYNAVFDNQAHTISVNIPEGASVKYGTADGTYELDDAPQYTNVGTYTVYYKVEKANYNAVTGSADVVITAKDIANAEIALGEALTYTGSELTRDFTVALLDGIEIDYTVSGNTGTDAGDYELTISGQGNFTGFKSANWSIAKAAQLTPETPVAVNETIKAKADGKITGVTSDMEYKLEGASEYIAISETEIANLAAGTYLVRYKENANHLAGADKQLIIADGAMITVSFNSNEGTAVDSITSEYNQAITAPAEPTKENFVFAGWYKDAKCLDLWNFGNALTEDITLYAKWNDKPVYSVSGKVTDGEFGLGGITVTLKQGNTIIATTTTAADGSYSFIAEDGLYNIVAEKEENDNSTIKTVKIEVIESANVNDVVFVATDINSELEIKPDTPQIIVGGLDEEAQTVSSSNGNVDVTVKMTVESAEDITGSDSVEGQEQRQTEQKEIKKVSGNRYIQFIEINLTQSISGAESTKLEETSGLIEIIIPFEKGNKRNITVYRYHGSASEKLGAGIGNANADGEYFEVKENHIVVYAKKFSTYAIGYDLPSSGGGGSSVTRYTVKFDTNGGSSVSSATVTKNAKVAEPKTPEKDGYTFGGWYTDEALTEKYDFDSKVTKNLTLYAKWDKHDDEQSSTDTHNCPSLAFDDLDITKWYHFDTDYVIENGIFKGTTEITFEPDSAQTRAMMVTVLYRVEGEPAVNRSIPFADVDMGAYYANAVIWGQQNGIIKGYSETEFGPDDKITREQIAAIMHRYAQYKGIDVSVGENTNILSYDDFDSISEYAIASMQYACGSGLIKGKSESTLNPLDNATRAEIAAILHRFIEANK